jgi:tetratricopeptide (TPR) repeat protein/transcriptional regulator with XRE-family HTH domain
MARERRSGVGWFGSALREFRAAANLTQEELADRSGLSVHAVGMLERGVRRSPRPATVELLANALRLDASQRNLLVAAARAGADATSTADRETAAPPPPTAYFVGREAELGEIDGALRRSGHVTVYGLGGVGKTQLAARFAHDNGAHYPDGVYWIRADQESSVADGLAGLAWRLNLPARVAPQRERRVEAVLRWLTDHPRWLLVLDNLEPAGAGNQWLPPALPGHILTTSRTPLPPPHLGLESFPPPIASRYLLERTGQADTEAAASVAEALGRLPLALAQAAAYVDQTGRDLRSYGPLLRRHLVALMAEGRPDDYPRSVVSTLSLSLRRLEDERPAAVALLRACAFLAGDDIPLPILQAGADQMPAPLRDSLRDEIDTDRTVAALRRYSLAERIGDALRVHPVVQAIVRDSLPGEERVSWLAAAVRLLAQNFPDEVDERPQLWDRCARLVPHARVIEELATDIPVEPVAFASCWNGVGVYLWAQGEYDRAGEFHERAAKTAKDALGPGDPLTVRCVQSLGVLRWYRGELAEARALLESQVGVLARRPAPAPGPDPEDGLLAMVLHNLASVVQAQGELAAARPLYQRALDLRLRVLGPEHPYTAYTLNNLGTLLRDQGDFAAARPVLEQALRIREKTLGPEHPETAHSLSNLGLLLLRQGDLETAEPILARALTIREKVLGKDHDRTARGRYLLGLARWRAGDHEKGRQLIRRAATDLRRRLGAEHRWTAQADHALADLKAGRDPQL